MLVLVVKSRAVEWCELNLLVGAGKERLRGKARAKKELCVWTLWKEAIMTEEVPVPSTSRSSTGGGNHGEWKGGKRGRPELVHLEKSCHVQELRSGRGGRQKRRSITGMVAWRKKKNMALGEEKWRVQDAEMA